MRPVLPPLHPFVGRDLSSELEVRTRARPANPFLVWTPGGGEDRTITYSEFSHRVEVLSARLHQMGVGLDDRVLVVLGNCPDLVVTLFACARLGAVAVLANPLAARPELEWMADHARSCVQVSPHSAAVMPGHRLVDADGDTFADGSLDEGQLPPRLSVDPARDLWIQYTSGTTARPKGVVATHANALWAGQVNARHTGLVPQDVYLVHLPLFHTNALAYSLLATFWVGATAVLMPRFDAERFWPVALRHGCTVSSMIPFCVNAIASRPVPDHQFRTWGSPLCDPPAADHFGVKFLGWWGMTETISHGIVGDVDVANHPMSCGRPALEYDIRVVDETGKPVASGETGALLVRGVRGLSIFSRYLDDPRATMDSFDEHGFFRTGDRVTLLADGHLRFADRDKDMLKVGGENVAASEVERVVATVPGVAEVAIVAKPHARLNEVPAAFVVLRPGFELDATRAAVIATCAEELAPFKVPRTVIALDELPRVALNKVAKAELRRRLADG